MSPVASSDENAEARAALVAGARRLVALGLNRGASGNLSLRVEHGLLITPSGVPSEALMPADMVFIDRQGRAEGHWAPSSEWRFHHDILARRADLNAVVHTHAIHATAIALCREPIPAVHYMIAATGSNRIACADYALFGTRALSDAVLSALGEGRACLMANHGMIACGRSIEAAVWLAEEVETLAHQYLLARQFGRPVTLGDEAMTAVHARFADYGPRHGNEPGPEGQS